MCPPSRSQQLSAWILVLAVFLGPIGCGGGSSGGGAASAVQTGEVAVLIADGPADEYDAILIDVSEVSLLPAGGGDPIVLFRADPPVELDLLDLRDEDFVLAVRDDIPAGTYAKVRLRVDDVRPVGGPCEDLVTRLPSGKIDLQPDGPIVVGAGETIFLRLDIDADKSIHLHPARTVSGSPGTDS